MINFSFLDPTENVGLPQPMENAGLYANDLTKTKKNFSYDYDVKRIEPDAIKYSSTYFELAKSHIPTGVRPGNNSIIDNKFVINDTKYNSLCYCD